MVNESNKSNLPIASYYYFNQVSITTSHAGPALIEHLTLSYVNVILCVKSRHFFLFLHLSLKYILHIII